MSFIQAWLHVLICSFFLVELVCMFNMHPIYQPASYFSGWNVVQTLGQCCSHLGSFSLFNLKLYFQGSKCKVPRRSSTSRRVKQTLIYPTRSCDYRMLWNWPNVGYHELSDALQMNRPMSQCNPSWQLITVTHTQLCNWKDTELVWLFAWYTHIHICTVLPLIISGSRRHCRLL